MNEAPRLLLDGMLGRLAKWLRLLGYDAAYDNAATDLELAHRARSEHLVLLTRDHELAARRGLHTLLIASDDLEEQLAQVQTQLGPPADPALSRCPVCNVPLCPAPPDAVADRVPPYVLRTHPTFDVCPRCNRVYWEGTHVEHMRDRIDMEDKDGPESNT
ncbi:MAG: Mut7-C RNAse domain-containing protein [Anaerolineae bacterium]|nr:Mut7-C RNAse domain-containing protein [Anaerolineae bacterium]